MLDAVLEQGASNAPPLDTVLLWLTATVEQDLVTRQACPRLRSAAARSFRGGASLHYLTADEAMPVLEDAIARTRSVSAGLLNAYGAHIRNIQRELAEAAERPFLSQDAICIEKHSSWERWRGTKEHLMARRGIQLEGPWPRETGGKRWALARDSRGYKTSITRFSTVWPSFYEARIEIPVEAQELEWAKCAQRLAIDAIHRAQRRPAAG